MPHIKCSYIDQTLQGIAPTFAFYFTHPVPESQLRAGLNNITQDYPLINGRMSHHNKQLYIDTENPLAPEFTSEKLNCSLFEKINSSSNNERLATPVNIKKSLNGEMPPLTIKITYFSCGGMCIGLSFNHAIGDISTIAIILKAWTNAVTLSTHPKPIILEDRESYILQQSPSDCPAAPTIRYLTVIDMLRTLFYLKVKERKKETLKFYFSPSELNNLKVDFSHHCDIPISTNDALVSHLFFLFADMDRNILNKTLSLAANIRHRLNIPALTIGNFVDSINLSASDIGDKYQLATKIRGALNSYTDYRASFHTNHQLVERTGGVGKISRFVLSALDPIKGNLLVTNWDKSGLYDISFGEGRLIYFTPIGKIPLPWVSAISEGPEKSGLIYTITLPERFTKAARSPDFLAEIHQYRESLNDAPELVHRIAWIN